MSSFYIEHTTKDKDKFEQIDKKSEHQEETKIIQNIIHKNQQSTSMWNKHTYDIGTWTKEKITEVTLMNSHQSWATIVNKTPKQKPYSLTINSGQGTSTQTTLSTLTINTPEQKNKKKKTK